MLPFSKGLSNVRLLFTAPKRLFIFICSSDERCRPRSMIDKHAAVFAGMAVEVAVFIHYYNKFFCAILLIVENYKLWFVLNTEAECPQFYFFGAGCIFAFFCTRSIFFSLSAFKEDVAVSCLMPQQCLSDTKM